MNLGRFPRVRLGHFPTPFEMMPNLTRYFGGPNLYIKRDDCTGMASGGNKTRKLEFLLADALLQGADTLVTLGALQSNHVRQTIAAAARTGLKCKVLIERRVPNTTDAYLHSGNVLLDHLLGGDIAVDLPAGSDLNEAADALLATLRQSGHKPYFIPGGGSSPVGTLGYVACAQELLNQSFEKGVPIDHVVHATGSTGTQAGLVVGLRASNSGIPVYGVCVRAARQEQEEHVWHTVQATLDLMGLPPGSVEREDIVANSDYVGEGYGIPTAGMAEALRTVAQQEAILLDPVYSGKAMAGLFDLIRSGHFKKGQNIVFVHTGGTAGLFGYSQYFTEQQQP